MPGEVVVGGRRDDAPAVGEAHRLEAGDEARAAASRPTSSSTSLAAESAQRNDTTASIIDSSRCWPPRPFARANSAAVIACDAYSAVTLSAAVWRRNTGTPSAGSAWLAASPPYAWITVSYALRSRYGPTAPKPDSDTYTTSGLTAREVVVAEAELVHHAGPEVLDHHVGLAPRAGARCRRRPACAGRPRSTACRGCRRGTASSCR